MSLLDRLLGRRPRAQVDFDLPRDLRARVLPDGVEPCASCRGTGHRAQGSSVLVGSADAFTPTEPCDACGGTGEAPSVSTTLEEK